MLLNAIMSAELHQLGSNKAPKLMYNFRQLCNLEAYITHVLQDLLNQSDTSSRISNCITQSLMPGGKKINQKLSNFQDL